MTDEVILARFVKGFFGGYAFAPEGLALRVVGKDLLGFEREFSTECLRGDKFD